MQGLSETTRNGFRILRVEEERLDAALVDALRKSTLGTIQPDDRFAIDCERVEFVDSLGNGLLQEIQQRVGRTNFGLLNVSWRLARCLGRIPPPNQPRRLADDFVTEIVEDYDVEVRAFEAASGYRRDRQRRGEGYRRKGIA